MMRGLLAAAILLPAIGLFPPRSAAAFEWPGSLQRLLRRLPVVPGAEQAALLHRLRDFPASEIAPHAADLFATVDPQALPALISLCTDLRVPVGLQLEELLAHTDPEIRAVATRSLGLVGSDEAALRILRRLQDGDAAVREAAADALGRIGADALVAGPLIRALEDRHRTVARTALTSVVRRRLRSATSALVDRALDGASPIRIESYRALGVLRADSATHVLIAGLADSSPAVRLAAAEALAALRSRSALVPLTVALKDTPAVAWTAADALSSIGAPEPIPDLLHMLRHGPARPAAARALVALHAQPLLRDVASEPVADHPGATVALEALHGPLARLTSPVPQSLPPPLKLPDALVPALFHPTDAATRAVAATHLALHATTLSVALLTEAWPLLPASVRPVVLRALSPSPEARHPGPLRALLNRRLEAGGDAERRAILAGYASVSSPRAPGIPPEVMRAAAALRDHPALGPAAQALLVDRDDSTSTEIRTLDMEGRPVPRVPLDLTFPDGRTQRVQTDGQGRYSVHPPEPIEVRVRSLIR